MLLLAAWHCSLHDSIESPSFWRYISEYASATIHSRSRRPPFIPPPSGTLPRKATVVEDGCPTSVALEWVKNFDLLSRDPNEVMSLVRSLWEFAEWGWREEEFDDFGRPSIRYSLSTGGWSGNESIIGALRQNRNFFWTLYWEQSRRGGHYQIVVPKNAKSANEIRGGDSE